MIFAYLWYPLSLPWDSRKPAKREAEKRSHIMGLDLKHLREVILPSFDKIDSLKAAIRVEEPSDFFKKYIADVETKHFSTSRIDFVAEVASDEYQIDVKKNDIVVVGSSKIGFALHNKYRNKMIISKAFREYDNNSDIDIAICSPSLFQKIWNELSGFACDQMYLPYRHKKLNDYLLYGWLRPDHFPTDGSLLNCKKVRTVRGKLRLDRIRGHPKVELALFGSIEQLQLYQTRSIRLCRENLGDDS